MVAALRNNGRPGHGLDGDRRRRRRPVGSQGQAARIPLATLLGRSHETRADLRQRWLHVLLGQPPAHAAPGLGRAGHDDGQDEDRPRAGPGPGPRRAPPARRSDPTSGYSSMPTVPTARRRRSPSPTNSPASASAGLRSRSPPRTWTGCARCARGCRPAWRSPPASTAMTRPTSSGCSTPAPSTSCRPTSPAAAGSPACCGVDALCRARSRPLSLHCAPTLHANVGVALETVVHVEYFHDHVRIEEMLFDGGALATSRSAVAERRERPVWASSFAGATPSGTRCDRSRS